jgi:hypothetical protein
MLPGAKIPPWPDYMLPTAVIGERALEDSVFDLAFAG